MKKRKSGILCHITSLPSKFGIGDLGPAAYQFADFLKQSNQSLWQVLPLNPVSSYANPSPYNCLSAFAANTLLISPEILAENGLIKKSDLKTSLRFIAGRMDIKLAADFKSHLLKIAFNNFKNTPAPQSYRTFCQKNKYWLDDYALFVALKKRFRTAQWNKWPAPYRNCKNISQSHIDDKIITDIEMEKFAQYIFFSQWKNLKQYCKNNGLEIIGDIPIYVAYQSADVWANQKFFRLDKNKKPSAVAGVPPDFFSSTGQLWSNPVYNWPNLKKTGYNWWIERIKHNLNMFDVVRIDHFRGFVAYWQVPASHRTAKKGRWVKGPGIDLFNSLFKQIPSPSIIVEDLGHITPDVRKFVDQLGFPCMKVLLFAFDSQDRDNAYLPHNHIKNCVVYTGTHDNNTIKGWFRNELSRSDKKILADYLQQKPLVREVNWQLIKTALASVADTVIIPAQDIIGLDQDARMNLPATSTGNWLWRLKPRQLTTPMKNRLKSLTRIYARC